MRRLVFALVLLVGCAPAPEASVAIGVVTPRGGDLGVFGDQVRRGVEAAIEEARGLVRVDGTLVEVQPVHRDDHGTPSGAAQSLRELAQEGVLAVIGPSSDALAARSVPLADDLSMPLVVPWVMDDALLRGSGFAMTVGCTDGVQGAALAAYAITEHRASRAAIVYEATPYGTNLVSGFRRRFARGGRRIVATEDVSGDLRAAAGRVAASAPDVVLVAASPRPLLHAIARLREAGVRVPVVAGDAAASPDFALLGGGAADGVAFVAQWTPLDRSERSQRFARAFRRKFDAAPEVLSALGYDATVLILDGLARAGRPDREALRDRLVETAGLALASGRLWMRPGGAPEKEVAVLVLRGGRPHFARRVRAGP